MKQIIKIFLINIITIFLLSMFYSIFFQGVEAKPIDVTNITKSTYSKLQKLAENADDEFFNFDAKKFVKNSSLQDVGYGSGEAYNHNMEGGLCYAVKVHDSCRYQHTVAIMDVLGDSEGTVIVYSKNGTNNKVETTTTKYQGGTSKQKEAVLKAYEAAYYAYRSSSRSEEGAGNGANWKAMLRHWSFVKYTGLFKKLGIPNIVLSSQHDCDESCGYSSDDSIDKRGKREDKVADICTNILEGNADFSIKARFVLQCSHKSNNQAAHSTGQNRGIYCGVRVDETPRIKITKQAKNKASKKLKGAVYSIYKLNANGQKESTVATNLVTNKNGQVTCSAGLQIGATYEIVETKPPTGYTLNKISEKITLQKGENKVTFKNEKDDVYRLTIDKIDADTGNPLKGAVFGIFRYGAKPNGGFMLDASNNFVSVPDSDKPNATVATPSNASVPKSKTKDSIKRDFVKHASGNIYYYSSDYYSLCADRSAWKDSNGNDYTFTNDASKAKNPYVNATILPYTVKTDSKGNRIVKNNGKYKMTAGTVETKLIEVKTANRGQNYWKIHYKPQFYNKSTNKFEFKSISDMIKDNKYHLTTDAAGEVTISGDVVTKGKRYYGYEVTAPAGYIYSGANPFYIGKPKEEKKSVSVEIENDRPEGNLLLKKVNKDHPNIVLNGVGFRFLNKEYGWVVKTDKGIKFTEQKNNATVFTTGKDGKTLNDGCIYIKGLRAGNYTYYEDLTSLSKSNPSYGAVNSGIGNINVIANTENQHNVENVPLYVTLSGDIWVDGHTFKDSSGDNLYNPLNKNGTGEDKKLSKEQLEKTTVELVAKNPSGYIDEDRSKFADIDENGHWKMDNVEIALLNGEDGTQYGTSNFKGWEYYLEFSYDGLIYDTVSPWDSIPKETVSKIKDPNYNGNQPNIDQWFENVRNERGSKARELTASRDTLNQNFARVDGVSDKDDTVQAKNEKGKTTSEITYTLNNATATIKDATNVAVKARVDNDLLKYNRTNDTSYEIKHINLGLREKLQTDLALLQDIEEVDVGIKGEHHVYQYNSVGKKLADEEQDAETENAALQAKGEYNDYSHVEPKIYNNVGVMFRQNYANKDYCQPVYRADFVYNNIDDTSKNLDIILTYKIILKNQTSLKTRINNIIDYYDTRYTLYKVGTGLDDQHHITGEIVNDGKLIENLGTVGNNNKIKINLPSDYTLGSYTNKNLYIQFKFKDISTMAKILTDVGNVPDYQGLENTAEISSYTTYKNDKYYAVVDSDSVLDNATVGKEAEYEDDTRSAPGIGLVLKDAREIKGYVFKDATDKNKLNNENIRQGNGQYLEEDKDERLGNIDVELLEYDENTKTYKQVQYMDDESFTKFNTKTDNKGEYSLSGFAPGRYIVRFTWGGENPTYKPTEYKATIYNNDIYEYAHLNTDWFKKIETTGKDSQLNKSYALDVWETRQEIDDRLNVDGGDYNFASKDDSDQGYDIESINKTQMQSNTLEMKFQIEYDANDLDNLNVVSNEDNKYTSAKFITESINFGITERPRQNISIEKRLKNIKLKYSSGETVVDADISRDGVLDGITNYTSYIGNPRNRRKALVRIEADTEILQNSSMEAIYELIIRNEGEREYYNEDFYNLGKIPDNEQGLVSIKPSRIMDYLSNESTLKINSDINKQTRWELKTASDIENITDKSRQFTTAVENCLMYLTDQANEITPKHSNNENDEKNKRSETALEIETEKRLSANYKDKEDITNQVEIAAIKKTFGRRIATISDNKETIPGNFIPNRNAQESDDSMGEIITIVSSTGANKNYVIYVTISIVILSAIAIGIYYVKKKKRF